MTALREIAERRCLTFVKAHALGNDFLLFECAEVEGCEPGELALRACDRHTGIGADGIVILGPASPAETRFRIYNSDGSEAGLSGNALRCAAAWVASRASQPPSNIRFATRVGPRDIFFVSREARRWFFRAEVGHPVFRAADVPFTPPRAAEEPVQGFALPVGDVTLPVWVLNMGNPQCILFVENWETSNWAAIGSEIERHPYFPDRTNVGFVRALAGDRIEARFWERGAGHTLASGTGSCACAVTSHLAGKTGRRVTVLVERGEAQVNWRDDGMVELSGPAELVAEGRYFL